MKPFYNFLLWCKLKRNQSKKFSCTPNTLWPLKSRFFYKSMANHVIIQTPGYILGHHHSLYSFNIPKYHLKNQVAGLNGVSVLKSRWESFRNFKKCVPSFMCSPRSWESSCLRGTKQWFWGSHSMELVLLFLFCVTSCGSGEGRLPDPRLTEALWIELPWGKMRISLNSIK